MSGGFMTNLFECQFPNHRSTYWVIGYGPTNILYSKYPSPPFFVVIFINLLENTIDIKKWNCCWHWSGLSWHMGGKEGGPWGWWYILGNTRIQAAWLGKALGMPGWSSSDYPVPLEKPGGAFQYRPTPTEKARRKSQGKLWLKLSEWEWQHEHAEKINKAL